MSLIVRAGGFDLARVQTNPVEHAFLGVGDSFDILPAPPAGSVHRVLEVRLNSTVNGVIFRFFDGAINTQTLAIGLTASIASPFYGRFWLSFFRLTQTVGAACTLNGCVVYQRIFLM